MDYILYCLQLVWDYIWIGNLCGYNLYQHLYGLQFVLTICVGLHLCWHLYGSQFVWDCICVDCHLYLYGITLVWITNGMGLQLTTNGMGLQLTTNGMRLRLGFVWDYKWYGTTFGICMETTIGICTGTTFLLAIVWITICVDYNLYGVTFALTTICMGLHLC